MAYEHELNGILMCGWVMKSNEWCEIVTNWCKYKL